MKRASYRAGIAWIALNDDPGSSDAFNPDTVSELISVGLLADLFDQDPKDTGFAVVEYRLKDRARNAKPALLPL